MIVRVIQLIFLVSTVVALAASPSFANEQISIQVSMPSLVCGKGVLEHDQCILSGTMRLRGPENINGPIRYFCTMRYSYVAAGSENQAIRFNGRVIFHGESILEKGQARRELSEQLTLKLTKKARQVEVDEIGCEPE